ncbi:hypothetical protein [Tianweitania sediminis]|uniref:Uncharacterized protein n=1 Tax=Tianweitania sediminis TaxID=1502156 RepID=A0A8J7R313_9HYPH|nr:hypothetical protein [Tianweitania sediminis]MBP0439546.1 hypothetical protein [Tianweitania sediminis]
MTRSEIEAALATIDIAAADLRLTEAEARRERLLLETDDDAPVLAAEAAIAAARIDRDRQIARKAVLEAQLEIATAAEERDALQARHDAVKAKVDHVVRRLREEYPALAKSIIAIAEAEHEADEAVSFLNEALVGVPDAPPFLQTASERVWGDTFLHAFRFREALSLPATDCNPAHGAAAAFITKEAAYALGGVGTPQPVPVHSYS